VKDEEERVQTCGNHSVCVKKFRKVYSVPFSKPILAVEKASFAVNEGECFALLGVNGAGKSTTFKSLTNVVEPTAGKINILGVDIAEHFDVIRYRIGYCPQ
jgi:ABC-type multidrug transport system ATPase subunit